MFSFLKKNKTIVFVSAFALFLSACSAKLIIPSQSDVDRVATKYPGYSLNQLNEGKTLYMTYCKGCHGLKNPASKTEEQWNKIVPVMVKKVNRKKEVLTSEQQESILKYVITMSSHAK